MVDASHSELLLQSPIPVLILTPSMEVKLANDAFLDLSGYERSEVVGRTAPFPWWDRESNDEESLYKKGVQGLEKNYLRKDRSQFRVKLTVFPIIVDSSIRHYLVSMVEAAESKGAGRLIKQTGLKAREEALECAYAALQQELAEKNEWGSRLEQEVSRRTMEVEKNREFWEQLFQQSPEGIIFLDGEDRVIQPNRAFCEMFGYPPEEVIGQYANDLVGRAPGVDMDAERLTKKLLAGESFSYDTYRTKRDGTLIPVSLHASPFRFHGEAFAYCGYRDITDRKKSEDQIKYHSSLQSLLARISYRFVLTGDDVDPPVTQSLEDFGSFFGACFCSLIQFGSDGRVIRSMGWHKIPPAPELDHILNSLTAKDIPWLWSRLSKNDVVIVDGLESLPGHAATERRLFTCTGVNRFALYPLRIRGSLSGAIIVGKKREEPGVDDSMDGMSNFYVFSSIISAALERHESRQALASSRDVIRRTFEDSIKAMGEMVSTKDPYTAQHQRNVSALCDLIAERMGMDESVREGLRIASLVHDLGKIKIPAEILNKPGVLSALEFDLIREHPVIGSEILSNIRFPWPVSAIVLQHHERMNGSGYPSGMTGGQILPQARVLAVADVVDAMTSHRPYRPGLGLSAAVSEIKNGRGVLYDPAVVDACLDLLDGRKDLSFLDVCLSEDVTAPL